MLFRSVSQSRYPTGEATDDLVKELRAFGANGYMLRAADEIVRLRKERDDAREFIQAFVNYANGFATRPRAAVTYNDLVDFIQSNLDDAKKFLKKNTDGK